MKIQLSDHFTYKKLFRFTLPSIAMMIFTSIYGVVDGYFISNYVGTTEFSAVNLIIPFTQILGCIGLMFGSGGSAIISQALGENNKEKANKVFSMLTYIAIGAGAIFAVAGIAFTKPIALLLGADEDMLPHSVLYARMLLLTLPAFMLQNMFQSFLITAEKPNLGLFVTILAGVTNMVLDALFVIVFKWAIVGAAAATCIAQCIGGVLPLIYFLRKNSSLLRLGKTDFDGHSLLHTCTNGSSELVTNISASVVSMLYNAQLMKLTGKDGVAAYGAVMYVSFIFIAIFFGYSIGVAPVVGYHYGANDEDELKNLFKKSNILIAASSIVLAVTAFWLAKPLAEFFIGAENAAESPHLIEITIDAFRYFAVAVLFSGFTIFGSAFFTALGNGVVSATISFLRTLVFQIASVLILAKLFGLNGIWYSLFVAEFLAMAVTFVFFAAKRKQYRY